MNAAAITYESDTGAQNAAVRIACDLSAAAPVFSLQDGMGLAKLHALYQFAIKLSTKAMAAKNTPGEDQMLSLLIKGNDYVSQKELFAVLV